MGGLLWRQYRIRATVSKLRTGLRLSVLAALILALAGVTPPWVTSGRRVLLLLDASASLRPQRAWMLQRVEDCLAVLPAGTKINIATFGEQAAWTIRDADSVATADVDAALQAAGQWGSVTSDFELMFDGVRRQGELSRVFVWTDGNLDVHKADALRAFAPDAEWIFDLPPAMDPDCAVVSLTIAGTAPEQHVSFDLASDQPMRVPWRLSAGSEVLAEDVCEVSPVLGYHGSIALQSNAESFRFELLLNDAVADNNIFYAVNPNHTRPRGLVVSADTDLPLTSLAADIDWRFVAPEELTASTLQGIAVLVIDNLPARRFAGAAEEAVANYLRGGGGVLMTGFESALGPGGWADSKLASLLPVDCLPRRQEPVCLLLAVDRSGSMSEVVRGDLTRLQMVKDATTSGILPQLNFTRGDRLGLIAFHEKPELLLSPGDSSEGPEAVRAGLDAMSASGRTDVLSALQAAWRELEGVETPNRQLIVLSDGEATVGSQDMAAYAALGAKFAAASIGVTVLAAGEGRGPTQAFVDAAGGRVIRLEYEKLESILQSEAGRFKALHRRGDFEVTCSADWKGFAPVPKCAGYVVSAAKDGAEVFMRAGGDPLVVAWQAGSGRCAVFASALRNDTCPGWDRWPQLRAWATRLLDAAGGAGNGRGARVRYEMRGGEASLIVELDETTSLPPDRHWRCEIVGYHGGAREVEIHRTGRRELRGEPAPLPPGAYSASLRDDAGAVHVRGLPLVVNFHPEWRRLGPAPGFFDTEAATVLTGRDRFADLSVTPSARLLDRERMRRGWVLAALLLATLELALAAWKR